MKLRRDNKMYEVIDATEQVWFEVTPECIAKACRLKKQDCVIARAMSAAWPEASRIEVGSEVVLVFLAGKVALRYGTTLKLSKALNDFDKTGKWSLGPGQYYLRPPKGVRRLGYRVDNLTPKGIASSKARDQRPKSTGAHVLRKVNPRYVEFYKDQRG